MYRMKILPFKAVYPILEKVPHKNDFFDTVKFRFHDYLKEGLFKETQEEAIFIYRITNAEGHKFTGFIAGVDIDDYMNGNIKIHEKTIVKNENLQSDLLEMRGAAIKPVLLMYPSVEALTQFIATYLDTHKKFYIINLGNEKHCFWQVTEPNTIEAFQEIISHDLPVAYIADGHHRSATFAHLHQKNPSEKTHKMLCAFFPQEELRIHSFNRVVSDLNGLSSDDFLEKLTHLFKIKVVKRGEKPYTKFQMAMFLEGKWFELHWRKSELKEFAQGLVLLDVHLLNEKILKPMLGVKNIREDPRVAYIEGSKNIIELEKACPPEGVAFCLYPVDFEDIIEVADNHGTLPPKSTFFEPRMKNGLLGYEIKQESITLM
jgi:uncharacterized protein (DUF1015 family)